MTTRRKINRWNPAAGGHDQKVPLLESPSAGNTLTALIWNKLPGWSLVEVAVGTRGASLLTCLVNCSRQRAAMCFSGFSACVAPWDAPRWRTGPNAGKRFGSCYSIQNGTRHVVLGCIRLCAGHKALTDTHKPSKPNRQDQPGFWRAEEERACCASSPAAGQLLQGSGRMQTERRSLERHSSCPCVQGGGM